MILTRNISTFYIKTLGSILLALTIQYGYAQNEGCSKKKLASKDMRLEFDYRGQSTFNELSNGDSSIFNVVLYSKQQYRIFVVGEQKLGKIDYQVIVPRTKFNRKLESVVPKKVTVYKKDPNGFYLYNTEGERIAIGEETIMDSIWQRETVTIDEMVFDSQKSETPYWMATPNKTQLITVKVFVEKAERVQRGCIGVYVGREYSNIYQFRR